MIRALSIQAAVECAVCGYFAWGHGIHIQCTKDAVTIPMIMLIRLAYPMNINFTWCYTYLVLSSYKMLAFLHSSGPTKFFGYLIVITRYVPQIRLRIW